MWKEKYEALKTEFDQLREAHDALAERIRLSEQAGETVLHVPSKDSAAESRAGQLAAEKTAGVSTGGDPAVSPHNGYHRPAQAMFNLFREMAMKDPVILRILDERPELRVTREIRTVQAHASTLKGALGVLISEKFFDAARPFDDVRKEFIRRGFIAVKTPSRQIEGAIDSLVEMGFLTKEETGLLAVPGMKINIVEARG